MLDGGKKVQWQFIVDFCAVGNMEFNEKYSCINIGEKNNKLRAEGNSPIIISCY